MSAELDRGRAFAKQVRSDNEVADLALDLTMRSANIGFEVGMQAVQLLGELGSMHIQSLAKRNRQLEKELRKHRPFPKFVTRHNIAESLPVAVNPFSNSQSVSSRASR